MFEVTITATVLYAVLFSTLYYIGLCIYLGRIITIEPWKLIFYVSLFSLFGISGELLVNNTWELIFSTRLWDYHLYPAHGGDISYYFLFIWGGLGYYRYLNDTNLHKFGPKQILKPAIIMGGEAVVLELAFNGFFYLLFGSYIFFYIPENMGILSHLSCWQVIPFYFMVGLVTSRIISYQGDNMNTKYIIPTVLFYWMVIASIMFFK